MNGEAYPIPDPYVIPSPRSDFQPGDFVLHRWDAPRPELIMEILDARHDDVMVRYLNGDLICGEQAAWMPAEMFAFAPMDLVEEAANEEVVSFAV